MRVAGTNKFRRLEALTKDTRNPILGKSTKALIKTYEGSMPDGRCLKSCLLARQAESIGLQTQPK